MMFAISRPEGCLSDYALARRTANEMRTDEEGEARLHLLSCARCSRRSSELAREREMFAIKGPPLQLMETKERTKLRSNALVIGGGGFIAAMAAAFLFVHTNATPVVPGVEGVSGGGNGVRAKGGEAQLSFYVNHAGRVRLGGSQEGVGVGDALRFVYSTHTMRYLAVLSVDGKRHASVYYPNQGTSARAEPGRDVALPESTVLDETLGEEVIYGVFCPQPFAIEPLRRALEVAPDQSPRVESNCAVDRLRIHKEPPASP